MRKDIFYVNFRRKVAWNCRLWTAAMSRFLSQTLTNFLCQERNRLFLFITYWHPPFASPFSVQGHFQSFQEFEFGKSEARV